MQTVVAKKLADHWSPQQVSGWLKVEYLDDMTMRVSHETIYKCLYIQARGVLKKELILHLRSKRIMRRGKKSTTEGQTRGQIVDAVSIRERPPEVEQRAIPGHWEGDLLSGGKNTHIATLVERHSRFVMLVQIEGKDSDNVEANEGDFAWYPDMESMRYCFYVKPDAPPVCTENQILQY